MALKHPKSQKNLKKPLLLQVRVMNATYEMMPYIMKAVEVFL